jgi:TolB-like protein
MRLIHYSERQIDTLLSKALIALCLMFLCGCAQPQHFVREGTDLQYIQSIAVLPFENFTRDDFAGEKIRRIVITELLTRGVDVTEPGEVTRLLRELQVRSLSSIKTQEIQKVGETLGVDAVMSGSVESFGISKGINVTYPEVTINLMLLETGSGKIVWSVRESTGGASFWTRHFSAEGIPLSEAARNTVKEAIDTLY